MRRRHIMGPWGEEEDAEFTDPHMGDVNVVGPAPGVTVIGGGVHAPSSQYAPPQPQYAPPPQQSVEQQPQPVYVSSSGGTVPSEMFEHVLQLASDQRARALALFLEVPFCAAIALHPKVPGLLRLGAAALGVVRTVEVVQRQRELEAYLPELPALMLPVLASAAYGFLKGLSQAGREGFNPKQDVFGPVKEEFVYRGMPLWSFPNLPYGSTAVTFAADHIMSDLKSGAVTPHAAAARFGDVLLGGVLYEHAFRQFGLLGAAAAHIAHNMAIGWGTRARRHLP